MSLSAPHRANTLVIISTRMVSPGLPGKPLADICNLPMIVRVWQCAIEANVGKVLVAADSDEIVRKVTSAGGDAIKTTPRQHSGFTRSLEALKLRDVEASYEYVVILPGNVPLINPQDIRACLGPFLTYDSDISTLVHEIRSESQLNNEQIIKAMVKFTGGATTTTAKDFARKVPDDLTPPFFAHVPIYGWKRRALEKFVSLPVSAREQARQIPIMRALDNSMSVAVSRITKAPFFVRGIEDLERVRSAIEQLETKPAQ